ncbi:MAG TPA: hypothetical protein VM582_05660, partial [Candidatus Thermoplasmatota archaeon]|nr:hypothetical protein [Candidatus Thermoplasmatota archaeon]
VWHLYAALATNASGPAPRFTTLRATPDDDPVQRGCIWQAGGESPCRNLRDYISVREHEGRVLVAYADGCARCASAEQSRGATAHLAVLEGAPSLRDGRPLAAYG